MKKLFIFAIVAVLCMTFAFSVAAEDYTVDANGNAVFDNTIGFTFKIDDVNGVIEGEDSTILTSVDGLAKCGSWSVYFVADYVSENVYVAATDGTAMGGNPANVSSLSEGQIIVVIHSASSRPTEAETYPNWESCARASAINAGDYLVLSGIDLKAGTCTNGTMLVTTKDGIGVDVESSDAETESSEDESTSESSSETESSVAESSAVESSAADSVAESTETSENSDDEGGLDGWLWVIIGCAAGAVVGAALAFIGKKK